MQMTFGINKIRLTQAPMRRTAPVTEIVPGKTPRNPFPPPSPDIVDRIIRTPNRRPVNPPDRLPPSKGRKDKPLSPPPVWIV
jgi:hypothetical protein